MDLKDLAKEVRKKIINTTFNAHTCHIASCLSCVEILVFLYFKVLKVNPKDPWGENRDRFILSKGHAVAALYSVLAQRGFFKESLLKTYCKNGGKLSGHSTYRCAPGVEASTGSLGHGLPMSVGIALAGKMDKKNYRVFTLLSDGECDEGSNWEAALFASHHKLDNLVVIIDYNKLQAFGKTNEILNLEPLALKWKSFGWEVKEINGNDFNQIKKVFSKVPFKKGKPSLLISHTIKGKGVSFMEDKLEWHYYNLDKESKEKALSDIDKK
jgi:transketolase